MIRFFRSILIGHFPGFIFLGTRLLVSRSRRLGRFCFRIAFDVNHPLEVYVLLFDIKPVEVNSFPSRNDLNPLPLTPFRAGKRIHAFPGNLALWARSEPEALPGRFKKNRGGLETK